jgi:hypothetical protein
MQHPVKTYDCNMHVMQHSRSISATYRWNTWNIRLKYLKHMLVTWNICLQHAYISIAIYATSKWSTWKHTSETFETRYHRCPRPTWWEITGASKRRSSVVEGEDGGRRAARCGGEHRAEAVLVDHAASAWSHGELGGRSGSATRWAETVAAGAGAPHTHDAATGLGAVARTSWWSNRPAWKPSPVTSSVGVHWVDLQCIWPWVGVERSSLSHTSCGRQPQLVMREAKETTQQWRTTVCMPWPSATSYSEGGWWWKSEMRR